jgi:hypothetical protein
MSVAVVGCWFRTENYRTRWSSQNHAGRVTISMLQKRFAMFTTRHNMSHAASARKRTCFPCPQTRPISTNCSRSGRIFLHWKFIKLASDEMYITGMTLNNPAQPAVKSYSTSGLKQADAELRNRIRWLSTPQFMAQAWVNIGQTQGRYMELFGVAEPDYTRPPFFQTRRIGNAETLVPSSTHGQPNRAERRRLERKNHNFQ